MKQSAQRFVRWFYPGLGVKRWLLVALVGAILLANGISRWLTAEGMHLQINEAIDNFVDDFMSPSLVAPIFLVAGAVLIFFGIRQWMRSIVSALTPEAKDRIVDALFDMRLRRGYKIVAIGGGTGLSTLLRGLKRYTSNLTAIVTVSDDGGSSGRLQKELGVLPPGDIRNCLVALADDEALVTDLFRYRFNEGESLSGHSFGNLFLAAMSGVTGDFDAAVKASSRVLNIKGRVLPATLATTRLRATLADGTVLEGETNISSAPSPIADIALSPSDPAPLAEAIAAIREAHAIVLGPGSLFTSILPNLLVPGIAREIAAANCTKVYVCNVMTQPGETDSFTASAHVGALLHHAGARVFETVIVNEQAPERLLGAYALEGQVPVAVDRAAVEGFGVRFVPASVISETETVRHDPQKLAEVVLRLIDESVADRASLLRLPLSAAARSSTLHSAEGAVSPPLSS
ncbi:MAG: YvcK family protein [Candidatus Eremiobacteraeota bacterium]|nr:YvcK family protein [Candidatus Eremiobacteraeota bacterium]